MKTYLLVDSMNLFARATHVNKAENINEQAGLCLHIMLMGIRNMCHKFDVDHIVYCTEGKSWRYQFYPQYKLNRKLKRQAMTPKEREDSEILFGALDDFNEFIKEKTNVSYLNSSIAEADDLIGLWISEHPNDKHIILSTDSDFYQLLSDNVIIYNGVTEQIIKETGIYNSKDEKIKDIQEPEYLLFEKCIRGDKSDHIFSAYPRVFKKSTKNKVGILDAYADRNKKGYDWNNFFLQKWTDHNNKEHIVKDCYEFNQRLIDLTKQPDDIKEQIKKDIKTSLEEKEIHKSVGVNFMRFCNEWGLNTILKYPDDFAKVLNLKYEKEVI